MRTRRVDMNGSAAIRRPVARAQRFPLHLPLRYRAHGESIWQTGWTQNISSSGVLFQAASVIRLNAPVELSFVLPGEVGGAGGAVVYCHGEIVRTILPPASDAPPALAVRILDYHFQRAGHEDEE